LAAQSFGVFAKAFECLPDALEQYAVDDLGMTLHPTIEAVRQGKDEVVVGYWQYRLMLLLRPSARGSALALRTVAVSAAVIPVLLFTAGITTH
jgi:hypothetical protein